MKKVIIALASVVALAAQVDARTLTPEAALKRARSSADAPASVRSMRTPAKVTPALTLTQGESPVLYVIADNADSDAGYLIVSADDVAAPVLGYADSGSFDPENMPENMRWWLSEYQRQIGAAISAAADSYEAPSLTIRETVPVKLTTRWNQDAPYNNMSPTQGGVKCPTGCVATAMAQILKWHAWPVKGVGSNSYAWNGTTLSYDYANAIFKYADMANIYGSSSTTAQKDAVANLMYACGVSVNMNFRAEASGAVSSMVPRAMREFFGYDKAIDVRMRYQFGVQEWNDIVYNELTTNGPVYYAGSGDMGGHAFIADGYRDGYFHFNWGWGGMSDGYFLLDALNPSDQGIGGAGAGESFNQRQMVMVGVRKPVADSTLPAPTLGCSTFINAVGFNQGINFYGYFFNNSPFTLSGNFGVELTPKTPTSAQKSRIIRSGAFAYSVGGGIAGITCSSALVNSSWDGEYIGRLVWIDKDTKISYPVSTTPYYTGDMEVTFKNGQGFTVKMLTNGDLNFDTPVMLSQVYTNKMFGASLPYTYTAPEGKDVIMDITPVLFNASTGASVGRGITQTSVIAPGQNAIEYIGGWYEFTPTAGDYRLAFYSDFDGANPQKLGSDVNVTLTVGPSGSAMLRVNSTGWDIVNAASVNPEQFTVTATVLGVKGYFIGALEARITDDSTAEIVGRVQSPTIFISANETKTYTFSGKFIDAVPGKTYSVKLYTNNGSTLTSTAKTFTVSADSALDEIFTESGDQAEYFTLQGIRVANPSKGAGILLRRQGSKVSKVIL